VNAEQPERELRALALHSDGERETEALGERLGALWPAGALLALSGELGAGKTCFVRGFARGLGCREAVASPTFALAHRHRGRLELLHLDAWRYAPERAWPEAELEEVLGAGGACALEWAERLGRGLPRPRLALELRHLGPERRELRFELVPAAAGDGRGLALEALLTRAVAVLAGEALGSGEAGEAREPGGTGCVLPPGGVAPH
jgi:tRNA threonylcarbamoyladenosine biosynthesis protein TsaE